MIIMDDAEQLLIYNQSRRRRETEFALNDEQIYKNKKKKQKNTQDNYNNKNNTI